MNYLPVRERGIVLVVVLWIITLLSVMAGGFAYSMRTETLLTAHSVERAQARALAEAGIAYVMLHTLDPPDPQGNQRKPWVDGFVRQWRYGPAVLRISAAEASSKVDLNRGSRELLAALLQAAGVDEANLNSLLDAIEDWRDPDDLRRLNGAETSEYQAAGRELGPMNAPFTRVEELQQVLGMTAELYQRLQPWLTVHSFQPGIDPATASAGLLRALANEQPEVIEDYLAARAESLAQDLPLPPPPQVLSQYLSSGRGLSYHITVAAQLESGATTAIEAVVARGDGVSGRRGRRSRRTLVSDELDAKPYSVITWREGR